MVSETLKIPLIFFELEAAVLGIIQNALANLHFWELLALAPVLRNLFIDFYLEFLSVHLRLVLSLLNLCQ